MAFAAPWKSNDRIGSAIGVTALHALIGYAFITGTGFEVVQAAGDRLRVFDVAAPPPPPPIVEKPADSAAEGEAAPPNLKADPAPVVAPKPKIRIETPPPVVAAPIARTGPDASAGASDLAGPGTGAGGIGNGTGSGGSGDGTGAGGGKAQWKSGRITPRDYPRSASRERVGGSVVARLTVEATGRVSDCAVVQSSGHPDLDATTCRLIEKRFRYRPATNARGEPVRSVAGWRQDWWLERG